MCLTASRRKPSTSRFDKPFNPLIEIFYNLRVFEIDIGIHEVIVVSVFPCLPDLHEPNLCCPLGFGDPILNT